MLGLIYKIIVGTITAVQLTMEIGRYNRTDGFQFEVQVVVYTVLLTKYFDSHWENRNFKQLVSVTTQHVIISSRGRSKPPSN